MRGSKSSKRVKRESILISTEKGSSPSFGQTLAIKSLKNMPVRFIMLIYQSVIYNPEFHTLLLCAFTVLMIACPNTIMIPLRLEKLNKLNASSMTEFAFNQFANK